MNEPSPLENGENTPAPEPATQPFPRKKKYLQLPETFTIANFNVEGLTCKTPQQCVDFLDRLERDLKADLVILTEHWLGPDQLRAVTELVPPGSLVAIPARQIPNGRRSGGVMVYSSTLRTLQACHRHSREVA